MGAKQAADKRVHEQKRRVEELEKELAALKQENWLSTVEKSILFTKTILYGFTENKLI